MTHKSPYTQSAINWLDQLVAFDTTSRYSNLELIHHVQDYLKSLNIESRLTFNSDQTKANLWATIGPDSPGGVVLSGHTDVVPVDGQDWSSDPFKMEERGGRLFGRGTADMKGFVACAIAFAETLSKRDVKTPIHFAFSHDEEVGCVGVKSLITDMSENLPTPAAVIVGEPTSMRIVGGNKGGRGWRTDIRGVGGHSSLPEKGANAILAANKIINELVKIADELKQSADPNNGFDPYYSTLDLGIISGGTARNIIPEHCTLSFGFRVTPFDDPDVIEKRLLDFIAREVEPDLKTISDVAGVTVNQLMDVPALLPDETSPAETLLRHLTGLNESARVSYGTEAGHFQKAGVPGVIFGPGSIEQAHLPDEYIDVSQMDECCQFLEKLSDWAENT
ncbi:MAG: acetylornithine deacetylase [Pseudomonadota bacterium]